MNGFLPQKPWMLRRVKAARKISKAAPIVKFQARKILQAAPTQKMSAAKRAKSRAFFPPFIE